MQAKNISKTEVAFACEYARRLTHKSANRDVVNFIRQFSPAKVYSKLAAITAQDEVQARIGRI